MSSIFSKEDLLSNALSVVTPNKNEKSNGYSDATNTSRTKRTTKTAEGTKNVNPKITRKYKPARKFGFTGKFKAVEQLTPTDELNPIPTTPNPINKVKEETSHENKNKENKRTSRTRIKTRTTTTTSTSTEDGQETEKGKKIALSKSKDRMRTGYILSKKVARQIDNISIKLKHLEVEDYAQAIVAENLLSVGLYFYDRYKKEILNTITSGEQISEVILDLYRREFHIIVKD